jgi:hypothetical protein
MALDKLLQDSAAWLDTAVKRRVFEKVDQATMKFPDEQRARRAADVQARIAVLTQSREAAVASYDKAIALEQAELDTLQKPRPPQGAQPESATVRPDKTKKAKGR